MQVFREAQIHCYNGLHELSKKYWRMVNVMQKLRICFAPLSDQTISVSFDLTRFLFIMMSTQVRILTRVQLSIDRSVGPG